MKLKTFFTFCAASLAISVQAQSLISNGGFETGDFSGWTLTGDTSEMSVSSAPTYVQTGSYGAKLGTVVNLGYLSQTLATTPGATYQIDFWLENTDGTPNQFIFNWDGIEIENWGDFPAFSWLQYSDQLVATSASTTITFGFKQDPAFWGLDNVSVVAVPEPSTLALACLSGMSLLFLRRRK